MALCGGLYPWEKISRKESSFCQYKEAGITCIDESGTIVKKA
jgi:hypothetical protein